MQYSLPLAHYLLSIGLPLNVNVNLRLRGRPLPPCLLLPIYCLLLLLTINLQSVRSDSSFQNVTCGSVFKLKNIAYDVRLHSHDVKYGTGSGQQSVTGNEDNEDSNSNWVIKGPDSKHPCVRGEPIFCDSKIRLEHLETSKNLHSHLFVSPLSDLQEISAYGRHGEGDTGDIWQVKCPKEGSNSNKIWKRDDYIQFKHVDTSVYLTASGSTYGRPISGHMEIVGENDSSGTGSYWQVAEGIFIHPTTDFGPSVLHSTSTAADGSVDTNRIEL